MTRSGALSLGAAGVAVARRRGPNLRVGPHAEVEELHRVGRHKVHAFDDSGTHWSQLLDVGHDEVVSGLPRELHQDERHWLWYRCTSRSVQRHLRGVWFKLMFFLI